MDMRMFWAKNGSNITFYGGIASIVASVGLSIWGTFKVSEVMDEHLMKLRALKQEAKNIERTREVYPQNYDQEAYEVEMSANKKVRRTELARTAGDLAKCYWPAALALGIGITGICYGKNVIDKRLATAMVTIDGLSATIETIKKNITDIYGEDAYDRVRYGIEKRTVEKEVVDEDGNVVTDSKGKPKTEKVEEEFVSNVTKDDLCWLYNADTAKGIWDPYKRGNQMILRGIKGTLNDRLHTRGYVFFNEILEMIFGEEVPNGQLIGWLDKGMYGDDCKGDGYIDIKMVPTGNGNEEYMLIFNVDPGTIFDKIKPKKHVSAYIGPNKPTNASAV